MGTYNSAQTQRQTLASLGAGAKAEVSRKAKSGRLLRCSPNSASHEQKENPMDRANGPSAARKNRNESQREQNVIPELIGQGPEHAVGAKNGYEDILQKKEIPETDFEAGCWMNVMHNSVSKSSVQSNCVGRMRLHADTINDGGQKECRNENDPESHQTMQSVGFPTPVSQPHHAEYGAGYQGSR